MCGWRGRKEGSLAFGDGFSDAKLTPKNQNPNQLS